MREIFQVDSSYHQNVHSLSSDGSRAAIVGNREVTINDKNGKHLYSIETERDYDILTTNWNVSGNILSIVYEIFDQVTVWYGSNKDTHIIQIGFKDPSFLVWSSTNDMFALGTKKGNLVICNALNCKTETILGKHSSEITCGIWIENDILVLGGSDKTISFSNNKGQTIQNVSLNSSPRDMSHICFDECCYIAVQLSSEMCFMEVTNLEFSSDDKEQVKAVIYPPNIGSIECHFWQPDSSSILIGTSQGRFILQSNPLLGNRDSGYEILEFSVRPGKCFTCCFQRQSFVLIDNKENLQILEFKNKSMEEYTKLSINAIKFLNISQNGDLILASGATAVHCFLCHAPSVYCSFGTNIAFLSSHQNLTITNEKNEIIHVNMDKNSNIFGLGPFHLVIGYGNGNEVQVYERKDTSFERINAVTPIINEAKEFILNSKYLAVRTQSEIYVYEIAEDVKLVTQLIDDKEKDVCCFIMTEHLIIYSTLQGDLCFVHLSTMKTLCDLELKHQSSIVNLCSNKTGTIVSFADEDEKGFVYDTFNQELLSISAFPSCKIMMWDQYYCDVFHIFDGQEVHSFVIYLVSIRGPQVVKFGDICIGDNGEISILKKNEGYKVGYDLIPILCEKGEIICQSRKNDNLMTIKSDVFTSKFDKDLNPDEMHSSFSKYLVLNCLKDACLFAEHIDCDVLWKATGNKALEMMDIPVAIFVFQKLKVVPIVARLEEIQYIEERNLLSGHLATLFGDYESAETKFLMSSTPFEAIQMRRDFGQWNEALSLAVSYFPNEIKNVSILLATELELAGDLKSSLEVLEQALKKQSNENDNDYKLWSMVAQTSLRLGNTKKALEIADRLKSPPLYSEMASIILDVQNDFKAAAQLYELGQKIPDAIQLWLKDQNLVRVSQLLRTNTASMTSDFYNEYGFLCKKSSKFELAVEAFESASNTEEAIKISLKDLEDPKRALHIMRNRPCKPVALEASELCKNLADYQSAVEFLILGKYYDDAFELASTSQHIDIFVSLIGENIPSNLSERVGSYYESIDDKILSAQFFSQSPNCVDKALDIYIQLDLFHEAIELVKDNNHLEGKFLSLLQSDGLGTIEKKSCLHQYHLDMNNMNEALDLSNYIIAESMANSDYEHAYDTASKTFIEMNTLRVPIPSHFRSWFNILHSYHLAKKFVQKGNHKAAAPLLVRISENINMFAANDRLNLYIGTIIECQKSGLDKSALKYSRLICTDKVLKSQLEKSSFRRKIESIVRRTQVSTIDEGKDLYLLSQSAGLAFPICICSGMYLDRSLDWTFCPISGIPALLSQYIKFIEIFGLDPINSESISSSDIEKALVEEVDEYIAQSHCFDELEALNAE